MEVAINAGAEDIINNDDGSIEVITAPYEFVNVKQRLEAAGFKPEMGEVTMRPENEVSFTGEDAAKMQKLLDALEDCDDVQEVYTTASIDD
jgi:transcriptional/translational regulatory protein YebC/TACO1